MDMIFFSEKVLDKKIPWMLNFDLTNEELTALKVAILFHDIFYEPGNQNNEYNSWLMCENYCRIENVHTQLLPMIKEMIMATKGHNFDSSLPKYVQLIIIADLHKFAGNRFGPVWKDCVAIFKEFQKFDWKLFQSGQIQFLQGLKAKVSSFMPAITVYNIEKLITCLSVWEPKIAIYPGSFNPFHKGHLNILEKAEKIFDKVIIARGYNPAKDNSNLYPIPIQLDNRQVTSFQGLLTDYIAEFKYPVSVIRGLRNTTDMAFEQNQYRWMQDLDPNLNMFLIFCDKEYEHISSSGIREISKFKNNKNDKYLL